ncbi:MAG: hypothetical protein H6632_02095 [Anaerolineales bacterium]|nr:hypothetical protein [Anaerolineales bacterium]
MTAFNQKWVSPTVIIALISLIYVFGVLLVNKGDPQAFILLGTQFSQSDPNGSEGYDGQFAYQIALNPAGAAPYIDVPAYRYQRILYPLLARWLALGQAALIPWTLIIVNIGAITLGTGATERLLLHLRISRWYALVYGLYGGQLLSLRTDLNEPLAHAFVQLAMLAWAKERRWWAVGAFALAALGKETTLVFLAAYMLYTLSQRMWGWTLRLGLAAIPFVLYQSFLWSWLGSFGVGSGGAGATPFSPIPLAGWLAIAGVSVGAFLLISLVVGPMSILPSIAGLWLSLKEVGYQNLHPFVFCLLLNSVVILFLPTSTFREPVAMLRLTTGLMAAMLMFGAWRRSRRILNYSTFWIFTNVLLINGVAGAG